MQLDVQEPPETLSRHTRTDGLRVDNMGLTLYKMIRIERGQKSFTWNSHIPHTSLDRPMIS